jgi:hypothetical protein
MKFAYRIILLLLFLLIIPCTHADASSIPVLKDSLYHKPARLDSFRYQYFTGEIFHLDSRKEIYDLKNFQRYDFHNYLGNTGQAINEIYACQPIAHIGFNYFQNDFVKNLITNDSVRYYNTHQPYTRLFFLAGQKREANFSFIHSQNVNKNLNFTAYFKRIRSDGTYNRQATNLTSTYLSSNYTSPNHRYNFIANVTYAVDKPQVNGGIQSDSLFESPLPPTDKKIFFVNLTAAQRRYRNRSVYLKQFFNLGYSIASADSFQKPRFVPTSAFTITLGVSDEAITYADDSTDFAYYTQTLGTNLQPLNRNLTHDSVYFSRIKTGLGWNTTQERRNGTKRKIGLFLGVDNEIVRINQMAGDTALLNFTIKGGLFNYPDSARGYRLRVNTEYVVSGYNAGDYYANVLAKKAFLNRLVWLGVEGTASLKKPDYMNMVYLSNLFSWRNHFVQEGIKEGKVVLSVPKYFFEAGAFLRTYDNRVFYNAESFPQQLNGSCSVAGGYVYKELNLGNWCLTNKITYQHSSDIGVLQFPEWVTQHSLYFRHDLKKILFYQIGVDVFYYSAYYGSGYMPATGQFYSQLNKKTGDYPFGDLYVSMQIKTVRLFVKYENVNSGYPTNAYYLATHYPAPDRALKLGLTWIFNN